MSVDDAGDERLDELSYLAAEVFSMLADTTRVQVLWHLRDGELPVGALVERLGRPQSLVSQHLAKLRLARLVTTRPQGARVFYRLANDHVRQLVVDGLRHAEHAGPGLPEHHQQDRAASTGGHPR